MIKKRWLALAFAAAGALIAPLTAPQASGILPGLLPSGALNLHLPFAGYTWSVRNNSNLAMPGPNEWSAANASVDYSGALHLKVSKDISGHWQSAEIQSDQTFGYGTYTWTIGTQLSDLDPYVALGLFTESPLLTNHEPGEIDFEASRWGVINAALGAQFAVQPAQTKGHLDRVNAPIVSSVIQYRWTPTRVDFVVTTFGNVIDRWTYTGSGIPEPEEHHVNMNLWLVYGHAPTDQQPHDVVIRNFSYKALS